MSDLRDELKETVDEAEWDWLMPHEERGAVIVVAEGLDLVEVGVAIANDNVTSVQHWIGQCLIYKPSDEQKAVWNQNQEKRFNALIVQPYVLVQEKTQS
ncbi:MAG: DUF2288 domain-containing protein [Myxacorys chilensis ATA2-1-KO14]|jgi:hypothetical protein|nr:DUF2288 domain-containing protein [Myxacorys chilensis ATA2-1-KO14]